MYYKIIRPDGEVSLHCNLLDFSEKRGNTVNNNCRSINQTYMLTSIFLYLWLFGVHCLIMLLKRLLRTFLKDCLIVLNLCQIAALKHNFFCFFCIARICKWSCGPVSSEISFSLNCELSWYFMHVERQSELVCDLSNGAIFSNLEWLT